MTSTLSFYSAVGAVSVSAFIYYCYRLDCRLAHNHKVMCSVHQSTQTIADAALDHHQQILQSLLAAAQANKATTNRCKTEAVYMSQNIINNANSNYQGTMEQMGQNHNEVLEQQEQIHQTILDNYANNV